MTRPAPVLVNGREYRLPARPTVVITVDGCEPAYLDDALARGLMPRLRATLAAGGAYVRGRAQMPTFTNPNNLSIVTGAPPSVHGVPGNHYRDSAGGEVQLVDPAVLRAPSIHSEPRRAGVAVLAVTTKDELRRLLARGDVPCVSAERAHEQALPEYGVEDVCALVGRPNPGVFDWDCSHYALELGLAVHRHLRRRGGAATGAGRPPGLGLLYVSTTNYVQHKEGPGGALADRFHRRFDEPLGDYLDAGSVLGITADHGMNPKQNADRSPRVHYLEEALAAGGLRDCRVVLPITDPYTVHHGALGSFALIYTARAADVPRARELCAGLDGVEEVYTREEAAVIYRHPPDRIGDLSVAADGGSWRDQRSELASGACVARAAATYAPAAGAGFTHGFVQALNTELLGRIAGGERLGTTTLSVVHACPDGRVLATALGDAPIFHVRGGQLLTEVRPRRAYESWVAGGARTAAEADAEFGRLSWMMQILLSGHLPDVLTPLRLNTTDLAAAPRDVVVACTDGVCEPFAERGFPGIPPDELARAASELPPGPAVEHLLDRAVARGSEDDLTCAVGRL